MDWFIYDNGLRHERVKDHKESFPHNISFRLINPSTSDIIKVSKTILNRMKKEITSSIQIIHHQYCSNFRNQSQSEF